MELHARSEWTSRPCPTATPARDVQAVFVHHEGGGRRGNPSDKGAVLREIEGYVLGKGYSAIDYNLMVFADGSVWEGRGLSKEDGATLNWNSRSVSICAVGNFEIEDPTDALLSGIAWAIQLAHLGGWTAPGAQILGHRDSGFSTSCPGSHLYARMDTIRARVGQTISNPNPEMTPEQWAELARALEALDVEHGQAVDTVAAAGGRLITLDRWGGLHAVDGKDRPIPLHGGIWQEGHDVARRIVLAPLPVRSRLAYLRGWVQDLDGGLHPFAEEGKPLPEKRSAAYFGGGKIVDFNEA